MTDMGPSPTQLRLYEQCRGLGWEHVRAARVAGLNPDTHPDYKPSPPAGRQVIEPRLTVRTSDSRRTPRKVGKVAAIPPTQARKYFPR